MDAESKRASTLERNRYLNIVYFVESARSHTIRINLRHAKYAVGAAIAVAVWALSASVWIMILRHDLSQIKDRLESSLSAVFEYQIKNEKVFEIAYPADSTNSYYSETAQLASNNPLSDHTPEPVPQKSPEKPEPSAAPKETTIAAAKTTPPPAAPKETTVAAAKTTPPPSAPNAEQSPTTSNLISISAARLAKTGSKMTLNFAITNSNPKKAEGYIWAIATFASTDGKNVAVIAPEHAKLDKQTTAIASFKTGYRFSIQRFKDKTFEFKVPAELEEAKMAKLSILFTDLEGETNGVVELPVDTLAVNQSSDFPMTSLRF
jgi:hypothetical protein